ncbi:MAG TPA: dephospho-CoA kinase [Firmicutes bacterium]|nr:dephospho-CoA kinase [Bacillota bacterium]
MRLGLTGGLGSGKSRVAQALKGLGAAVVDADQLAREAVAPGTPGWRAVIAAFGREYLLPDGSLDRRKLGRLVFAEAEARHRLEAIVHPEVRRLLRARAEALEKAGARVVVLEVPLLYEAGFEAEVDKVVAVYASPEVRVARVKARDGLSAEEVHQRLAAQLAGEEQARRADYVIDNSGAWEETEKQVERLWEEILREETHRTDRP